MTPTVSWNEAFLAMLAMMTVLVFVLIYYCCIPCYKGMKKRKEREEQFWENDPRWETENFNFVPRKPTDFMNDKKYSRLAACSRTSSMRSTATTGQFVVDIETPATTGTGSGANRTAVAAAAAAPAAVTTAGGGAVTKKPSSKPPKYCELYETGSTSGASLGTPPRYTSKTPSAETSQENVNVSNQKPSATSAPKPKIIKPKKKAVTATSANTSNDTKPAHEEKA